VVAEDSQDGRAGLLNLHVCFAVQKVLGFISFSQNWYTAIFGCPIFLMNWKYNTVGYFCRDEDVSPHNRIYKCSKF
jgi:hypothetical protein